MMMAVLRRPPEHALLSRALRKKGKCELEGAACLVSAVRKIAMISCADRKDAQKIERQADCGGLIRDACQESREARHMHKQEGNGGRINEVIVLEPRRLAWNTAKIVSVHHFFAADSQFPAGPRAETSPGRLIHSGICNWGRSPGSPSVVKAPRLTSCLSEDAQIIGRCSARAPVR